MSTQGVVLHLLRVRLEITPSSTKVATVEAEAAAEDIAEDLATSFASGAIFGNAHFQSEVPFIRLRRGKMLLSWFSERAPLRMTGGVSQPTCSNIRADKVLSPSNPTDLKW